MSRQKKNFQWKRKRFSPNSKHSIVENGFKVSLFNKRDAQPKLAELNAEVVNIFGYLCLKWLNTALSYDEFQVI